MRMTHRYRKCSYMWGNINNWGDNVRVYKTDMHEVCFSDGWKRQNSCIFWIIKSREGETIPLYIDYSNSSMNRHPKAASWTMTLLRIRLHPFKETWFLGWSLQSGVWIRMRHVQGPWTQIQKEKKHLESKTEWARRLEEVGVFLFSEL